MQELQVLLGDEKLAHVIVIGQAGAGPMPERVAMGTGGAGALFYESGTWCAPPATVYQVTCYGGGGGGGGGVDREAERAWYADRSANEASMAGENYFL